MSALKAHTLSHLSMVIENTSRNSAYIFKVLRAWLRALHLAEAPEALVGCVANGQ